MLHHDTEIPSEDWAVQGMVYSKIRAGEILFFFQFKLTKLVVVLSRIFPMIWQEEGRQCFIKFLFLLLSPSPTSIFYIKIPE